MTVKTITGRVYKLVGRWDMHMVFAPVDGKDDEVMFYTNTELKSLLREGRLMDINPNTLQEKLYC